MTDAINNIDLGQADYMKLFTQELTYQDPLKPIDNREFMAQMAQFSTLQQALATNEVLKNLLITTVANQSINLLGKTVKIEGSEDYGVVRSIKFNKNAAPEIVVQQNNGGTPTVNLNQIIEVD